MNREEMVKELARLRKRVKETVDWGRGGDPKDAIILDLYQLAVQALELTEGVYFRLKVGDIEGRRDSKDRPVGTRRAKRIMARYGEMLRRAMAKTGNDMIGSLIYCDESEQKVHLEQARALKAGGYLAIRRLFTSDDEARFAGYTFGQKWNGFECPMFEKDQADSIMRHIETQGYTTSYDEATDTYKWQHEDDESPHACQGRDIQYRYHSGTCHVYAIGAFEWTWRLIDA